MRRFFAAVLRWFAAVPKTQWKQRAAVCGGWGELTPIPPYPYALTRAHVCPRAHFGRSAGTAAPIQISLETSSPRRSFAALIIGNPRLRSQPQRNTTPGAPCRAGMASVRRARPRIAVQRFCVVSGIPVSPTVRRSPSIVHGIRAVGLPCCRGVGLIGRPGMVARGVMS